MNTPIFSALLVASITAHAAVEAPVISEGALVVKEGDALFKDVTLRDGKHLDARIHYATAGVPKRDAKGKITNAVLLLHWTSTSGEILRGPAFVSSLYEKGKPLDATTHYLVFIDALGHGKSSKPSDGLHARFPNYGYEDIVTLQHRVVTETLGIDRLHAIVGVSMGGMNAWRWAERFPDAMDAIIPVVALPGKVSGRNLLWRRWVSHQIRSDPEWKQGEYTQPPRGWVEAFPIFRMMLDGVPHLHATLPDVASADAFIHDASAVASKMDANDVLYSVESSTDYDPAAELEKVKTRVFALNFGDDEFNPVSLGILEASMKRVAHGTAVVQPGTPTSWGHLTQAHPELWAAQIGTFMTALDNGH